MRNFALALLAIFTGAIAGSALAGTTPQEEANKQVVLDFYEKALNRMDFEAAARHFGPRYIQHNPLAADGIEGFKKYIEFRREKFPNAKSVISARWSTAIS
jgi:predicted SnoaL-like aldol condensation-catalyzing enzyme